VSSERRVYRRIKKVTTPKSQNRHCLSKAKNGVIVVSEIKSILAKIQNLISSAVDIPAPYSDKDPLLEVYLQEGDEINREGTTVHCGCRRVKQLCQDIESKDVTATGEITVTAIQDDVA
jgi:hypothetical protein